MGTSWDPVTSGGCRDRTESAERARLACRLLNLADCKEFEDVVNYRIQFSGPVDLLFAPDGRPRSTWRGRRSSSRASTRRVSRRIAVRSPRPWLTWRLGVASSSPPRSGLRRRGRGAPGSPPKPPQRPRKRAVNASRATLIGDRPRTCATPTGSCLIAAPTSSIRSSASAPH